MPIQKWDYALVQANIKTFVSHDGTPLHAELGQMGEKGWELVTTERMIGDDVAFIFKRPK